MASAIQLRDDDSARTQTIVWPSTTFTTTWTLGSGSHSTEPPATVAPAPDKSTAGQSVGPILSGVVAFLVLVVVLWVCCRQNRTRGRGSRRSSRRRGSGYLSKGSSSGSPSSNGSSRNGASVESAASEIVENQWDHADQGPEGPMPNIPPAVAGGWQPDPGTRMGSGPPGQGMGFPPGRGGPQPMMGRGGPPFLGRGGPPPMMGRGGPPPGAIQ
ncbi:hypothetical protein GGR53DRAFT_316052 [Hypoxylon sp. FL1150]|nr:hypothetical protein GGR53DRAFT_316052 [Hypoxylon sp. FL1150]